MRIFGAVEWFRVPTVVFGAVERFRVSTVNGREASV
jgi:hypothetical protein